MQIFDRVDPMNLERREWQLWLLAFTVIFILALGTALMMYPTVFSTPVVLAGATTRKAFFGFCALVVLLLGYFVDRQLVVRHLRQQLAHEQKTIMRIRHEASADLLSTLPDFVHFQDRLAMEYRRASSTRQPLSLVVVVLKSALSVSDTAEVEIVFGDAAKALMRKLRGEDSIYLFSPGVFCIVLPGVEAKNAYSVAGRLTEGLHDASGVSSRFSFELRVFNYPEHAKSAREIQEAVRPFIPKSSPQASAAEAEAVPSASQ